MAETGNISIHTDNILPIIKKWLYSEKEIFLRELIANAADAVYKLEKIALSGDCKTEIAEARIDIRFNKAERTISISDTGLGLTADEIKKYINQVAFSGVTDFVEKYQSKGDEEQVIGHFGLGFYSAFMVADRVEIDSLSYQEGAVAAHWDCTGSTAFTLDESTRSTVGTTITLHVAEDSLDLVDPFKLREILDRYCAFIRYPIYLEDNLANEPKPLWTKAPSALSDEDYKEFYQKLFPGSAEPLFWIHLNVDYPFKLRGVLFFPELRHELEASQGEVKLYCNQVYVADNPKELIPDFLALLKGAVDCLDLPLNVSRSYLQNDPQVQQIRQHIVKKVADKLSGLAKNESEVYAKYWESIHTFIKFGMLRDPKFYERMREHVLFKSTNGDFTTLDAYLERNGEKTDSKIIYASDPTMQAGYIGMLKDSGIEAIITGTRIDQHFLPYLEMESGAKYKFQRIDADVLKNLVDGAAPSLVVDPKDNKTADDRLTGLFANALGERVNFKVETLKSEKIPALLIFDEQTRRLIEMSKLSNFALPSFSPDKLKGTLVLNRNSAAVKNLLKQAAGLAPDAGKLKMMVEHIYDLASMQHSQLSSTEMLAFIERSAQLLGGFGQSGAEL